MKILFIGGTGNISADCAALLHRRGHEVGLLTRGKSPVPPEYRAILADRKDAPAMRSALKDFCPDVVLNFIGFDIPDVQADFELFRGSIKQYLFISSTTVYQKPARKLPYTEEEPRQNLWWDYAQKKIACEQWLEERLRQDRFPVTIVRPSHTYSRRWIPNAISSANYNFAARLESGKPVFLHDDGETPWTLTAASDFAVGLAGLAGNERAIGEAFHITGDEVLTWNQIYAEIAVSLGVKSPRIVKIPTEVICKRAPRMIGGLKGDKAHPGVFDNSKIKRFVPEFKTTKPFSVGIRESVEWLRSHPESRVIDPQIEAMIEDVIRET